jgi:hypothetical protein
VFTFLRLFFSVFSVACGGYPSLPFAPHHSHLTIDLSL